MSNKKFKVYCDLVAYLEAKDEELLGWFRGACILGVLRGKGAAGATLLRPTDPAARKKLEALAYSSEPDDLDKLAVALSAYVLRDVFRTPDDFKAKSDDIPNSQFPSQHTAIKSTTKTEVTFANGAVAKLDPEFKDGSKGRQYSVWLVAGEMPVLSGKDAKNIHNRKSRGKPVTGAYDASPRLADSLRYKIGLMVENQYMLDLANRRMGVRYVGAHEYGFVGAVWQRVEHKLKNVFFETSLSLCHYVLCVKGDQELFAHTMLPRISYTKSDFYNLVEPHKEPGEYLLPDSLIEEWWANKSGFCVTTVISKIDECLRTCNHGCAVMARRGELLRQIDIVRKDVLARVVAQPRSIIRVLDQTYNDFISKNAIGDVSGVYSEALSEYYRSQPGLKLAEDAIRFLSFCMFEDLERDFDEGRYNQLISIIGDTQHANNSEDRIKHTQLLHTPTVEQNLAPQDKIELIRTFINSTHFLFVPLSSDDIKHFPYKHVVTRPTPGASVLWNISAGIQSATNRLLQSANSEEAQVRRALISLDIQKLDPELRQRLLAAQ